MGLDLGSYMGMPAECYDKIMDASYSEYLEDLISDTGLSVDEIRAKLSTWNYSSSDEWYYDPLCNSNCYDYQDWVMDVEIFGAELGIDCPLEGLQIISSTQDTDSY